MPTKKKSTTANRRDAAIDPGHSYPDVDAIPIARMTSRQLHRYADGYNWDGGIGPKLRVIRHPKCDLGTALLIFWRRDPRYYFEALAVRDAEAIEFLETRPLMRELINKVKRGHFRTARTAFDPRRDRGSDWTEGKKSLAAIGMPEFMCAPVRPGRLDSRAGSRQAAHRTK
ncbi:MAG: DUF4274 domain-containing protein [Phycisphaerae bacterium]|nr:DUF4274 domain-containing protein [Phycisphaerae bacterium]NUQ45029.1 DUF4274 domain-containing protein [Phycisphaerae bacterium]